MIQQYTKQFELPLIYNQPLLETENFKVVPSLGSLVEGWVLIVPKKHYLSFGYLENYLFDELDYLHNKVIFTLQQLYNKEVVAFENGTLNLGSFIGCGVDYAHIHYVPIDLDIRHLINDLYKETIEWEKLSTLIDLKKKIKNSTPYLFFEDNNRDKFICDIYQPQSQLIRKLIAKHIGKAEQYDWKRYHFEENINRTIEKFETYMAENENVLQICYGF
jgi:diadenosine tetraphosphate (Ap4A) HIT family hydrolase